MKEIIRNIRLVYNDVRNANRVTIFFVLLAVYYILNLLTSPITSGMSGGLEAEHNIYNQVLAGLLVVFVLYYDLHTNSKRSYTVVQVMAFFLIYVAMRTYIGFATDTSRHSLLSFSAIVNYYYWGGGLVFCLKCFKYCSAETLKRMIQMVVLVTLVFLTYRLFTQKALLARLGMIAGINVAAHTYMLVPLVMLAFKGKSRLVLFLICGFICLYSAKRQSAVGMAIVTIFSLRVLYQVYFRKRKIMAMLFLLVLFYLGSNYISRTYRDLFNRQERLVDKDNVDSGRIVLWQVALNGFQNADRVKQWFGGGPGTGKKYISDFFPIARAPHNGFIQVLCDYGYIGLSFYVLFFLTLLVYTFKIRGTDNRLIYLSICFSWIFANVISHPGSLRFIFLAIGIGYIFYRQYYETNQVG